MMKSIALLSRGVGPVKGQARNGPNPRSHKYDERGRESNEQVGIVATECQRLAKYGAAGPIRPDTQVDLILDRDILVRAHPGLGGWVIHTLSVTMSNSNMASKRSGCDSCEVMAAREEMGNR